MKLDRDISEDGTCKYALIDARRIREQKLRQTSPQIDQALKVLEKEGLVNWGKKGSKNEFFVIMLKDIHSQAGLRAYAHHAMPYNLHYSNAMYRLAERSGPNHPECKLPD